MSRRSPRAVSIKGEVYARLKAYAIEHNVSVVSVVEKAIAVETGLAPSEPKPYRRYRGTNGPGTP